MKLPADLAAASVPDLGAELDAVVRLVASVTDAFTTVLFLPEQGNLLRLAASMTLSDHLVPDAEIGIGQGLVGWVAEHARPIRVSPFRHDARTLQFYGAHEEIKTFLAVPVRLGERVGVLAVDSKGRYEFPSRTEAILTGFAAEIARRVLGHRAVRRALRNTPPVERLRELCSRIAAAEDPAHILDLVETLPEEIVPHRGVLVAWSDGPDQPLAVLRTRGLDAGELAGATVALDQSLVGWVQRRGTLLYLADVRARARRSVLVASGEPELPVRSFLGVPLVVAGRCAGVLAFTSDVPTEYPRQTADVLGILACVLASALDLAEARRRLRERLGSAPTALVPYGRFLTQVAEWLVAGATVELLVLDPAELGRRNRRQGYAGVDRLLEEALGVVARILRPAPRITSLGGGRWAIAWCVDRDRPEGATERLLARTFADNRFVIDHVESTLPVRIAAWRSTPEVEDPEELVRRALARLDGPPAGLSSL